MAVDLSYSAFFLISTFSFSFFFFFNDTATTEIYTLSLHDALPISKIVADAQAAGDFRNDVDAEFASMRSEEHTSELQSPDHLVCRLLLEKKKNKKTTRTKAKSKSKTHRTRQQKNKQTTSRRKPTEE